MSHLQTEENYILLYISLDGHKKGIFHVMELVSLFHNVFFQLSIFSDFCYLFAYIR